MQQTFLIQRLKKPYPHTANKSIASAFAFGGGLVRGGLKQEAWDMVNEIFSFDYMGAAEFEFGAVPTSLYNIYEYVHDKDYATGTLVIKDVCIYFLCKNNNEEEVVKIIKELAKENNKIHLKELCGLSGVLNKAKYADWCGWLELDNHFMFFTDKEMYEKTLRMFLGENKKITYNEKFPSLIGVGITLGDGTVYNQTQVAKHLLDKKRIIKLFEQAVFVEHLTTEQQDELWNILEAEDD